MKVKLELFKNENVMKRYERYKNEVIKNCKGNNVYMNVDMNLGKVSNDVKKQWSSVLVN